MNSKVALLLFVIGIIIWTFSLKFKHQTSELQDQTNTSLVSSPYSAPLAHSTSVTAHESELPKPLVVKNEPKSEEDTRNLELVDDVKNNPLRIKTKSGRSISKKRLETLSSFEDMKLFLEDLRFDTLEYFYHDEFLRNADPQSPDLNLNNVKGVFVGQVLSLDSQQKLWDMRMQFDGSKDLTRGREAPEGITLEKRTRIEISEDGQNFRLIPGYNYRNIDFLGFIVEPTLDDYVEMFYVPQKDMFIGNWYRGKSSYQLASLFNMKPKGTMILQRVP